MNCFDCKDGRYVKVKENYHTLVEELHVVVPDVEVLICSQCGDKIIGDEANNKIDNTVKEYKINKT